MAKKTTKGARANKSSKAKANLVEQAKKAIDAAELHAGDTAEPVEAKPVTEEKPAEPVAAAPTSKKTEAKKAAAKPVEKKTVKKSDKAAKVKPAAKKPGRKPLTAAEKAKEAKARAEEKAKAAGMVPTMLLQYAGKELDIAALTEAAKEDFKANNKRKLLTELTLYFKPEDGAVYYVANGSISGKVLF